MKRVDVHLHTNTNCNLRCIHCYNDSGESRDVPEVTKIINLIMDLSTWCNPTIHMEGGEIFLRPDLLLALDTLPANILKNITITTNGTVFNNSHEIIHMLKSLESFRVSVEGHTPELHEKIRGGLFSVVIENAKKYRFLGAPVCLRITLNRLNYDNFIHNTIASLVEQGFRDFQVYEFQNVGRGKCAASILSLTNTLENLLSELYTFSIPDVRISLMFPRKRVSEILRAKNNLESRGYRVYQLLPEDGISIHANGDVYKCAWDNDPRNILCNLYTADIALPNILSTNLTHTCEFCTAIKIVRYF